MRNGMTIIDADGHVLDWEPVYRERLPEAFRHREKIMGADDAFDRTQNGAIVRRGSTVQMQLEDNALQGIDIQVMYPTGGLTHSRIREPDYAIAFAETYNDFLHDYCAADPKRLKGVALVPLHVDVKQAIKEMERAVDKLGLVGVMVNTFVYGRNVAHRDFWPFYEACAAKGVAIGFHSRGGDAIDPIGHFDNLLAMHTLSHAPEQLIACTAIIYSGLLEQFPELKVAFLEAGAGWVPYWMEHMDGEWGKRKFDAPLLKAAPSEYMRSGRVYVSCEPEERTLPYVAEWLGEDQLLFPSDYPHWDCGFPDSVDELAEREDVSEQLKRKIFCDNPQRLYGFTAEVHRA
jgi:predicted TIM-barrel fold metal-dependent hydrolase